MLRNSAAILAALVLASCGVASVIRKLDQGAWLAKGPIEVVAPNVDQFDFAEAMTHALDNAGWQATLVTKPSGTAATAFLLVDASHWAQPNYLADQMGQITTVREERIYLKRVSLEVLNRDGKPIALASCKSRSKATIADIPDVAAEIVSDIDRAATAR